MQLAPLTSLLSSLVGEPVRPTRRRGRPPGKKAGAGLRAAPGEKGRPCAVIGCPRASRTKGYCSAHYQKLRMLTRTNRRPPEWIDFADPQSVKDVVLPRGRAMYSVQMTGRPSFRRFAIFCFSTSGVSYP